MGEIERHSLPPGNTWPGAQSPRKPRPTPTSVLARGPGPSSWIRWATGSAPVSTSPVFLRHVFFSSLSDSPPPQAQQTPRGWDCICVCFGWLNSFFPCSTFFRFLGIVFHLLMLSGPWPTETHAVCLRLREESGSLGLKCLLSLASLGQIYLH